MWKTTNPHPNPLPHVGEGIFVASLNNLKFNASPQILPSPACGRRVGDEGFGVTTFSCK